MTGVIVIKKEQKFTSFDVVAVMRGITKVKKIGHTGTLDPMATGVLPILIGNATKACDLLPNSDKTYVANFQFGIKTNTGDIWGEVKKQEVSTVSKEDVEKTLENFRGEIYQIPPMYSAVSVNGQRLYDLARKGIEVEREKRKINISKLDLIDYNENQGKLLISCSKGTYIRTLIEDIAQNLGTIATMTGLERTFACGFSIEEAVTLSELEKIVAENQLETVLKPVEDLFQEYPITWVTKAQETRYLNGGELDLGRLKLPKIAFQDGDIMRVYGEEFLGLGRVNIEKNCLKFLKKF